MTTSRKTLQKAKKIKDVSSLPGEAAARDSFSDHSTMRTSNISKGKRTELLQVISQEL